MARVQSRGERGIAVRFGTVAQRIVEVSWSRRGSILNAAQLGAVVLLVAWAIPWLLVGYQGDAHGYWLARLGHLYDRAWPTYGASPYSPVFHQLIVPLTSLAWPAFYALWVAVLVVALAWLVTPLGALAALLLYPPATTDVLSGNINTLLAVGVVLAFRTPRIWPLMILTKVTPGVGLVWFAARGAWRYLLEAAVVTLVIIGISAFFAPGDWLAWLNLLRAGQQAPPPFEALALPLWLRLLAAAGLAFVGGRRNWPWILPIAVTLALPVISIAGLVILLAIPRLLARTAPHRSVETRVVGECPVAPHALEVTDPVMHEGGIEVVRR
jgi:hypothetical protein